VHIFLRAETAFCVTPLATPLKWIDQCSFCSFNLEKLCRQQQDVTRCLAGQRCSINGHFISFLLAILLVLKGTKKCGRSLSIYIYIYIYIHTYITWCSNTQTNLALCLKNGCWAAHLPFVCPISCTGEDILLKIQRLFQALPFYHVFICCMWGCLYIDMDKSPWIHISLYVYGYIVCLLQTSF